MSKESSLMGFIARRDATQVASRDRSVSRGVTVELDGWEEGLNKVRLTQTFKESGYRLSEAMHYTGRLLDGAAVRVSMPQFATVEEARAALKATGVRNVRG